jgi:hypothetical protein
MLVWAGISNIAGTPVSSCVRMAAPMAAFSPEHLIATSSFFDLGLCAGSASTVGTGNGKSSRLPEGHEKWNFFKITVLIFLLC